MNSVRKALAALAISSAALGATSIAGAPGAEARICYPGGYCPAVMQMASVSFGVVSSHSGGCGDFRTSVRPEAAVPTTMGTFSSRPCFSGEPFGNVIGFFQGSWGFALRWSVNGRNWTGAQ